MRVAKIWHIFKLSKLCQNSMILILKYTIDICRQMWASAGRNGDDEYKGLTLQSLSPSCVGATCVGALKQTKNKKQETKNKLGEN